MTELIKHFTKNPLGKDYVVGDIHGAFKKLYKLLETINFDFEKDRLFSVGDLCDRGPDSIDVLQWLSYPWFFPVMGNHEQILLLYEAQKYSDKDFISVGGAWWFDTDKDYKKAIVEKYQDLPVAIEVETTTGLVGIIHAICPHANWNKLPQLFSGANRIKMINKALWSMDSVWHKDTIENVKAVVVGHMTQEYYVINGNTHLIDTGGVYQEGHFTILNLENLQVVS